MHQIHIFFLLLITSFSYAQKSPEYKKYKLLYPDARAISLNEDFVVKIELKGNEIAITEEQKVETLYLDGSAKYNSEHSISYNSFFDINKLDAKTYVFDGKKYKAKKVTQFHTKDDLKGSFHDDTKTISFVYPNLEAGAKTALSYQTIIKNPRFLKTIFLSRGRPILKKKITFYVDNNINIDFKTFNLEGIEVKQTKKVGSKQTIYTWEINETPEFKYNDYAMSFKSQIPHIIPIIKSYTVNGEEKKLLNDVSGLYSWYYSLIKDINNSEHDPELIPLVDSLTKGCTSELDKVKNIYYWTQQNIKYIAFEDGLGGFVPREANDIYKKKYGDCKDNSSILDVMLEIAGIEGHITWVGTREIPYKYSEVPTPVVDNHMILTYIDKDSTFYFLDATGRYLDIDMPSSFIQGKETLIAIDSTHFLVQEVPIVEAKKNKITDICQLTIAGDSLFGNASVEISGYPKTNSFAALEQEQSEEKIKSYYKEVLEKGNNNFLIDKIEEKNKFEYEKPFLVNYHFTIPNYIKNVGDEIYINLNLEQDLSYTKPEKSHNNMVEYKYKAKQESTFELTIPEGYTVSYIPDNLTIETPNFNCSITYSQTNQTIKYQYVYTLDFIRLSKDEVKDFVKNINKVEKAYKEVVVLTKK